jgi:integrase
MAITMSQELVPTTSLPATQNAVEVYVGSLAERSRLAMAGCIKELAKLLGHEGDARRFPWHTLRFQHTTAIRTALLDYRTATGEPLAPATINMRLAALRGVLKAAWNMGQLSADEYSRAVAIKPVSGSTEPRGRALEYGELKQLFRACSRDVSNAGRRDAAILGVLYGCGLRRDELVRVDLADYQPSGELLVRQGKGRKDRKVYATNGAQEALMAWLEVRGNQPGPLFVPINKGAKLRYRKMTSQAVYNMLQKRAHEAGLSHFSPHDLRRTFISDLLEERGDVSLVQKLAGHANVNTTLRYDRRPEQAKRKLAESLHVPFVPAKE